NAIEKSCCTPIQGFFKVQKVKSEEEELPFEDVYKEIEMTN
ncbi:18019_t:CDS:2, partial [Gigaspora margarita]